MRNRKTCSKECYTEYMRKKAKENPNCGGSTIRNHGQHYFCKDMNKIVWLDSSWEIAFAKYMDANNIKWIRPKKLVWIDSNEKTHNYFADFYLINEHKYIDTKNEYLCIIDAEKIERVIKQNNINLEILRKKDLLELGLKIK